MTLLLDSSPALSHAVRVALLCLATVIALTSCAPAASFPPSGAMDASTVDSRALAEEAEVERLEAVAPAPPVTTATYDVCSVVATGFKFSEGAAWQCQHTTWWVIPDTNVNTAEMITRYQTASTTAGCTPNASSFDTVSTYWATLGSNGVDSQGKTYTVDRLPPAEVECDRGATRVGVAFHSPAGLADAIELRQYADGYSAEVIEANQVSHESAIAAGTPHLVVLWTSTAYHYVSR